jgi:hypothetical protein
VIAWTYRRLQRQAATTGEPAAHARWPGVVGGCGKPEIPELAAQLAQEFRRLGQRLHGVEGIEQAPLGCGAWHELRNPLRVVAAAGARAGRVRLEPALLPDHAGEKFQRQTVLACGRFDHPAHRFPQVGPGARLCRCRRFFAVGVPTPRPDLTLLWGLLRVLAERIPLQTSSTSAPE